MSEYHNQQIEEAAKKDRAMFNHIFQGEKMKIARALDQEIKAAEDQLGKR